MGNGSVCNRKYIYVCRDTRAFFLSKHHLTITFVGNSVIGVATAVITDSVSSGSNYTVCSLVRIRPRETELVQIINSGNTSLTSSKGTLKLLALAPTG